VPFGWVAAGSALVGTAASLAKGSGQSGAISDGQQQANAAVQPWVTTGTAANTRQADLLGLNGQPAADTALAGFKASPGYGYQVEQGLRAVDAGAAARGMLRSGATLKAEQTLGNNLADQDFGNYIDRLNKLSTTGESAGVNQASTDTGAASNQASIYGSTVNGVSNSLTGALGNKDVQNGLTGLFSSGGAGDGLGTSSDLYTGGLTF
jgi:hypothetical protein